MKCKFCDNPMYVERLNCSGLLEAFCVECIDKLNKRIR